MIRAPIPARRDGSGRRRGDHRPRWHAGEGGGLLVVPSGRRGDGLKVPGQGHPRFETEAKALHGKKSGHRFQRFPLEGAQFVFQQIKPHGFPIILGLAFNVGLDIMGVHPFHEI